MGNLFFLERLEIISAPYSVTTENSCLDVFRAQHEAIKRQINFILSDFNTRGIEAKELINFIQSEEPRLEIINYEVNEGALEIKAFCLYCKNKLVLGGKKC